MKAAMLVKWSFPYPGRETAALAYGREVDEFWGKKAAEGVCSEPKWFWGTTGENFWFVEAEFEVLLGLMATPEVQGLLLKGGILVQDFEHGLYQVGREEMFVPYEQALADLKIK